MEDTVIITQVVRVRIAGSRRDYTYAWHWDPTEGGTPLKVGDKVEIPPNQVQEEGAAADVTGLGSSYTGPMKAIVRVIDGPKAPSPEDDLWGGWETGAYE